MLFFKQVILRADINKNICKRQSLLISRGNHKFHNIKKKDKRFSGSLNTERFCDRPLKY